ncbi:hypothetical protein FTX61_02595 [Nitriliruptoraceae bacterium ZYF776]|nr:hypothetical protein [Profundirhabdus halotolerans]
MLRPRAVLPVLLSAAVLAGCSGGGGGPDDDLPTAAPDDGSPECPSLEPVRPTDVEVTGPDPATTAQAVAGVAVRCAETVVVAPADDPALAAVGAPLAAATSAPLLLDGDLDAVLGALGGPDVRVLAEEAGTTTSDDVDGGTDDGAGAEPTDGEAGTDVTAYALQVADELEADRLVLADRDRPEDLAAAAALATPGGDAVVPVAADALPDTGDHDVVAVGTLAEAHPDLATDEDPWAGLDEPVDAEVVWAVDPGAPEAASVVTIASLRGDAVLPVPDGDLLATSTVAAVRDGDLATDRLVPVGQVSDDPARDVALLTEAPLLPGGSLRYFEGTRMVAVYGRPGAPSLGALGEQDLEETLDRVREVAEGYDADGRQVIPTLEVIVSVATGDPQADESYSNLTPAEEFRELVDRAGEEDMQVILDLQPGRTDFLTQARAYEELLREPHVGLALDPEWRLEDDQVHLEQIGGVEAAEVQEVVDWYAELTRDAGLSQNLLVLHQFRHDMLRDRDTIEIPPEIAAVVHADGQGEQALKMETWRALTAEGADRWHWGWKNFYDEDPVVATPDEVLELDPEVVLVTYQ